MTVESNSYTPTITGNNNFACNNVAFAFNRMGQLLDIVGRLNITNAGSGNGFLTFTLPNNWEVGSSGVAGCGLCKKGSSVYFSRCDDGKKVFLVGDGGSYSLPALGTGYLTIYATLFIKKVGGGS